MNEITILVITLVIRSFKKSQISVVYYNSGFLDWKKNGWSGQGLGPFFSHIVFSFNPKNLKIIINSTLFDFFWKILSLGLWLKWLFHSCCSFIIEVMAVMAKIPVLGCTPVLGCEQCRSFRRALDRSVLVRFVLIISEIAKHNIVIKRFRYYNSIIYGMVFLEVFGQQMAL